MRRLELPRPARRSDEALMNIDDRHGEMVAEGSWREVGGGWARLEFLLRIQGLGRRGRDDLLCHAVVSSGESS